VKVTGAFNRSKGAVESVLALSKEPPVATSVKRLNGTIEFVKAPPAVPAKPAKKK